MAAKEIIPLVQFLGSADRFWSKVDKGQGPDSCWNWTGTKSSKGYGYFSVGRTGIRAHRFAYTEANGEIKPGLQLDHLCRNRSCVNPAHLEAVDSRTNILRGEGYAAQNARKLFCRKAGHELPSKMNRRRRERECLICHRIKQRDERRDGREAVKLVPELQSRIAQLEAALREAENRMERQIDMAVAGSVGEFSHLLSPESWDKIKRNLKICLLNAASTNGEKK